jgi:hypothetical protein
MAQGRFEVGCLISAKLVCRGHLVGRCDRNGLTIDLDAQGAGRQDELLPLAGRDALAALSMQQQIAYCRPPQQGHSHVSRNRGLQRIFSAGIGFVGQEASSADRHLYPF